MCIGIGVSPCWGWGYPNIGGGPPNTPWWGGLPWVEHKMIQSKKANLVSTFHSQYFLVLPHGSAAGGGPPPLTKNLVEGSKLTKFRSP